MTLKAWKDDDSLQMSWLPPCQSWYHWSWMGANFTPRVVIDGQTITPLEQDPLISRDFCRRQGFWMWDKTMQEVAELISSC